MAQQPYHWCSTEPVNCHHDYNAADIFAPTGTKVVSPIKGTIINVNSSAEFGSNVEIRAEDGTVYYMTHMGSDTERVHIGQQVVPGTFIGKVGTKKDANGTETHVHIDHERKGLDHRVNCSGAACANVGFLSVQGSLIQAFKKLPATPAQAHSSLPAPADSPAPSEAKPATPEITIPSPPNVPAESSSVSQNSVPAPITAAAAGSPDRMVAENWLPVQPSVAAPEIIPAMPTPNTLLNKQLAATKIMEQRGGVWENRAFVMRYFLSHGLTVTQAAALVGNGAQESQLNATSRDGAFQWEHGGRYDSDPVNLVDFARSLNKSPTDLGVQCAFVLREFKTSQKAAYNALINANTLDEATTVIEKLYERAGKPRLEKRIAYAHEIADAFNAALSQVD